MTIIINLQILPCLSTTTSFVFGDSLVDAGNNNYLVSLSRADFPPNGIDFPPNGRPTGRFTNGRTIADIVGTYIVLIKHSFPFLEILMHIIYICSSITRFFIFLFSFYVGEGLGVKPFPPPYFAPNAEPNAVQSGLNYASGASGILDETGSLFVSIITSIQHAYMFILIL